VEEEVTNVTASQTGEVENNKTKKEKVG